MLASSLRLLRTLLGSVLAAASIVVTVAAGSVAVAMAYVFFTEHYLSHHDRATWRWAASGAIAGAFLSWASIRLANAGRPAGQRTRSFRVDPESVRRWERWPGANMGILLAMATGAGWLQTHGGIAAHGALAAAWTAGFLGISHGYLWCHEFGHLGAGKLAGMQPLSICVGSGPLIWRRVGASGFWWEWRLWPAWGRALATDRAARPSVWRFLCLIAGGPLVGGLFMALALWTLWRGGVFETLRPDPATADFSSALALIVLVILAAPAVACLVPYSRVREGQTYFSDGWWLCRAFFLPKTLFLERAYSAASTHWHRLWHAGYREHAEREKELVLTQFPLRRTALTLLESQWYKQKNEPSEAEACFQRALEECNGLEHPLRAATFAQHAALLALAGKPDVARTRCEAVLAQAPESERDLYLDVFACVPIYHRAASALLPDAERWCAEALRRSPEKITLRGTWGSVLSERARVEEALPVLREVLASEAASDNDRGIASFYLALDAKRRKQRREWRQRRTEALRWCKVPGMVRRIHAELRWR